MNHQIVNTEHIIGADVINSQNEKLGKIEAIMLDKMHGRVAYVILSFGGFLGLGDKLFALPWSMLSYNSSRDCFTISVSKEILKNSPGFEKDDWPDMSNLSWRDSIDKYYGINRRYPDQH